MSRPRRTGHHGNLMAGRDRGPRSGPHLILALQGILSLLALTLGYDAGVPAAAQTSLLDVSVRHRPTVPVPGDTVSVDVRINGCSVDGRAELYLTMSDGATTGATLMASAETARTVFLRRVATVSLPQSLAGWYGVRVVCGDARPLRQPLPNTTFVVGSTGTARSTVTSSAVPLAGPVTIEGTECRGSQVEVSINQVGPRSGPFVVDGTIPVGADGSWSGSVTVPPRVRPGVAQVQSRCIITLSGNRVVRVPYGSLTPITITAPPG